jgi:hypothetical protein
MTQKNYTKETIACSGGFLLPQITRIFTNYKTPLVKISVLSLLKYSCNKFTRKITK